MRISIDDAACAGHGRCFTLVPSLFEDDDQGRGVPRSANVADDALAEAEQAVRSCPERAISLWPA
jgi:ferredoxin